VSTERADDSAAISKHHNPEVDGRKQTIGYVVFRDCEYNE